MGTFASSDEVYATIGHVMSELGQSAGSAPRLLRINRTLQFDLTDPACRITARFRKGQSLRVDLDRTAMKPETVIRMSSDVAHRFFLGELNIFLAMDRGEVSIYGPAQEFLAAIPQMRVYVSPRYRGIWESKGEYRVAEGPAPFQRVVA